MVRIILPTVSSFFASPLPLFVLRINMERSSFYISHFFRARPKCLKLWGFRLWESRGIFFAVCSYFLFEKGSGEAVRTDFMELCTSKLRSESEESQWWTANMSWWYESLKCALGFIFVCSVFLHFKHLEIQISVLKSSTVFFCLFVLLRCGLSLLSREIQGDFHHLLVTVSLVLSWWPPTFSFAALVVWGASIMKTENGWPSDSPQDVPPYYRASL